MADLLRELQRRLPEQRIKTDPDIVLAYSQDRAIFEQHGIAAVLVSPHSTEEVVEAMKAAEAANAKTMSYQLNCKRWEQIGKKKDGPVSVDPS